VGPQQAMVREIVPHLRRLILFVLVSTGLSDQESA
jgi:hypothetical protein